MARVDLFCVPEYRHRVILLVDLLEPAGQSLKLHTAPVGATSDPLLLVCTAVGLRSPWLAVLDWRQRRRLPDEPCVPSLLAHPGFKDLEAQWQAR